MAVVQLLLQRHADVSICHEVCTITLGQCIESILSSHPLEGEGGGGGGGGGGAKGREGIKATH